MREYDFIDFSRRSNHPVEVSSMEEEEYLKKVREVANRSPYYRLLGMEVSEIRKGKSRIQMPS